MVALIERAKLRASDEIQAERDLQAAIDIQPKEGYPARAELRLFVWKNYDGAIADYQKILSWDQTDPDSYYDLGQAQLIGKHFDEAKQTFLDSAQHITVDEREGFVQPLQELQAEVPYTEDTVRTIILDLQP